MRVHISANVEVFTGGHHHSWRLCMTRGDDDESLYTQTHRRMDIHTDRTTNLIISSNVHFVPLAEIIRSLNLTLTLVLLTVHTWCQWGQCGRCSVSWHQAETSWITKLLLLALEALNTSIPCNRHSTQCPEQNILDIFNCNLKKD